MPKVVVGEAVKAWRFVMDRKRSKIEGKLDKHTSRKALPRACHWGLPKAILLAIVTATMTNLNRLAKLLEPGQRLVSHAA